MKKTLTFLLLSFVMMSCASLYRPIHPEQLSYSNNTKEEHIEYSYIQDVLSFTGNKKYAKIEDRLGIKVLSVSLKNTSDKDINITKDLLFKVDSRESYPMESYSVTSRIKQGSIGYLLWCLFTIQIGDENESTLYPIGIPIAALNMLSAGNANSAFRKEFNQHNMIGKTVAPGETLTGLLAFQGTGYGNLEIEMKQNSNSVPSAQQ